MDAPCKSIYIRSRRACDKSSQALCVFLAYGDVEAGYVTPQRPNPPLPTYIISRKLIISIIKITRIIKKISIGIKIIVKSLEIVVKIIIPIIILPLSLFPQ